jgi:transposase
VLSVAWRASHGFVTTFDAAGGAAGKTMIATQLRAEIRRLHEVEGWRICTIARQLGVHHGTIRRALSAAGVMAPPLLRRNSRLDAYLPWLREQLAAHPTLAASVLFEMARRRGYDGGPDHFRHRLRDLQLRPRSSPEAFFNLTTLPGEQAQVDWADFGARRVHGGVRRLFAFVMVLSFSRSLFVRFFYDARLPSFLAGHVQAFERFGGVPRLLLYDNLKSAVLERVNEAIRFQPRLLELADHYGFEPRPVAPRRGNEKGRVERAIRYLRTTFFPLRQTLELSALNVEADRWTTEVAARRPWQGDRRRTVASAYAQELPQLRPLPLSPLATQERVEVHAAQTPYVTFDANRYSIPHQHIARTLTVAADLDHVRVFDRHELIAVHPRSYAKAIVVEDEDHLQALTRSKRHARLHRGQNRLLRAVPEIQALLVALAARRSHLLPAVDELARLLDENGPVELAAAVGEALAAGSPHPDTVRLILDRRRHQRGAPPPLPIALPDDPRVRNLVVTPHRLADYDPQQDPEETDND